MSGRGGHRRYQVGAYSVTVAGFKGKKTRNIDGMEKLCWLMALGSEREAVPGFLGLRRYDRDGRLTSEILRLGTTQRQCARQGLPLSPKGGPDVRFCCSLEMKSERMRVRAQTSVTCLGSQTASHYCLCCAGDDDRRRCQRGTMNPKS